jgi:hypothetical protein
MLHLELGDVFGDARGFFPQFQGDDDFFEGADGHLVGDPAGRVLQGAVEDREFDRFPDIEPVLTGFLRITVAASRGAR